MVGWPLPAGQDVEAAYGAVALPTLLCTLFAARWALLRLSNASPEEATIWLFEAVARQRYLFLRSA